MKTSTVLKRAKNLLITKGWTRRYEARDAHSHAVPYDSPRAARFCIIGACCAVSATESFPARQILCEVAGNGLATFNDSQKSVKPILEVFDEAIKLAVERGQ